MLLPENFGVRWVLFGACLLFSVPSFTLATTPAVPHDVEMYKISSTHSQKITQLAIESAESAIIYIKFISTNQTITKSECTDIIRDLQGKYRDKNIQDESRLKVLSVLYQVEAQLGLEEEKMRGQAHL